MAVRGPFALEVPGYTFRFELHDYGGPFVLGKHGQPLANQPGGRSLFWEAYWQWDRQGRRVDDQGRCIFNWETALVQITDRGSRAPVAPRALSALAKPTPTLPPKTARVTVRSTRQEAEVFVDDRFVGNVPVVLTLPAGKHQFRAVLEGYKEWSKELELIPDSELTLIAKLVKLARKRKIVALTDSPRPNHSCSS